MNAKTPWIIRNAFQLPGMATEISDEIGEHMARAAWKEGHRRGAPKSAKSENALEEEARVEAAVWRAIVSFEDATVGQIHWRTGIGRGVIDNALIRMVCDGRVVKAMKPCKTTRNHAVIAYYSIAGAN